MVFKTHFKSTVPILLTRTWNKSSRQLESNQKKSGRNAFQGSPCGTAAGHLRLQLICDHYWTPGRGEHTPPPTASYHQRVLWGGLETTGHWTPQKQVGHCPQRLLHLEKTKAFTGEEGLGGPVETLKSHPHILRGADYKESLGGKWGSQGN